MLDNILFLIYGTIGSLGYAVVFHSKGKVLWGGGVGGLLCGIVYLVCTQLLHLDSFYTVLVAGAMIALYSEFGARVIKCPAVCLFAPSIITLIPGGLLYYTLNAVVTQDSVGFSYYCKQTVLVAFGIALGACIIWAVIGMKRKIEIKRREEELQ